MSEVGFIKTSHTCHWRIPDWSKLRLCTEYSSPPLYIDDLKWTIKLYKGRPKSPKMLSLFVKLHETRPGSLRGIRKKVQLILKVHNTNPSNYYNDFGVGKRLHPVWFSEKHTQWGEDALAPLDTLDPFLNQNQASLSINISILKSKVDLIPPVAAPGCSPFACYLNSPDFSDIQFRVQDDEEAKSERVFYGHKNILSAMSPWFRGLFTSGMRESFESVIDIEGVSADVFSRLLQYCYTFNVNIHGVQDAQDLLEAADRFQISTVREEALRYMRQEINETNVWDIWSWADIYDCEKTCTACLDFVARNMTTLIKQPSWLEAKGSVVKKAMQIEDGILPSEEELYEALMKWVKYPTDVTSQDDTETTEEQQDQQKNEKKDAVDKGSAVVNNRRREDLAEIIPFIRFPLIQPSFLATVIEKEPLIADLDCTRDLLFEAYRYHALAEIGGSSFRCKPRRVLSEE